MSAWRLPILVALALAVGCGNATQAPSVLKHVVPYEGVSEPSAGSKPIFSKLYSGSAPVGDAAFEQLKQLGVQTVLSVDGAIPDLESATAHGMRYVHLPIGYDGLDEERAALLVRVVRDLPKPVYLHCHHGQHRSACAAAVVAISLGWLKHEAAVAQMNLSGTSAAYQGLWESVARAEVLTEEAIDAAPSEFPSLTQPLPLVSAMVAIDAALDQITSSSGKTLAQSAAHAGTIADLLRVLGEEERAHTRLSPQSQTMRILFEESAAAATTLEQTLAAGGGAGLGRAISALKSSCTKCHAVFRDERRISAR